MIFDILLKEGWSSFKFLPFKYAFNMVPKKYSSKQYSFNLKASQEYSPVSNLRPVISTIFSFLIIFSISERKFWGVLTGGGGGCVCTPFEIVTIYGCSFKSTGT